MLVCVHVKVFPISLEASDPTARNSGVLQRVSSARIARTMKRHTIIYIAPRMAIAICPSEDSCKVSVDELSGDPSSSKDDSMVMVGMTLLLG